MEIIGRFTLVKNKYANTNRCINFKSKEREDELIAQFPHKTFDSNFFTQDGDSILLPLSYEETITYNYCYFNNRINNTEQKRYFCYITNYQYVEPNITRISIAVDTLQTFFFDIDKLRGNLNRCHAPRRINLGTTEAPKYIINPDLYFMEDEVDTYRPSKTLKADNPHQTYIVLTYALPVTQELENGEPKKVEGHVNQKGEYQDREANLIIYNNSTGQPVNKGTYASITFPASSLYSVPTYDSNLAPSTIRAYNTSTKDIGDTAIYTIILPTAPTNAVGIDYLPYETFKLAFPLLQDKLINSFYIDNIDETFVQVDGIKLNPSVSGGTYKYYAVPYTRLQALKKIIDTSDTELSPTKWVNRSVDDLTIRKIEQEKKLELYPYSFVKITSLGAELVWKYQENYKLLSTEYNDNCYSYVKAFNVLSPNTYVLTTLLFDKENLVGYDETTFEQVYNASSVNICDYFIQLGRGDELPSLSIYEEKYTNYLNYRKAIVDANNAVGLVGGIVNGGYDVVGSVANIQSEIYKRENKYIADLERDSFMDSRLNTLRNDYLWDKKFIRAKGGVGIAGGMIGAMSGVGNYVTTAIQEQAIKKQPMTELHKGSTSDKLFSTLFDLNGNVYDYVLTKYETIDNIKSVYEQKFYNYGYSIPVDVELYWDELIDIISNRKYFCFIEWNSLELESNIPTIYMNDMISRLCSGVRFENTSNTLLFQTYTINDNNKETELPAKPFFVREY